MAVGTWAGADRRRRLRHTRVVRRALIPIVSVLACAVAATGCADAAVRLRPWPFARLQIGLYGQRGKAVSASAAPRLALRYEYLSGGVNTGHGWQTWWRGNGSEVPAYTRESEAQHAVPVFSYYQLRESAPGSSTGDEARADLTNLQDQATMRAYFEDLKTFFERAASAPGPVVVQVEPDLWGYIERHATGEVASTVPAAVAASGMPELAGLPDTAAGFAQAVLVLRNDYAPRVIVGYHVSIWGTGKDIHGSHPSASTVARMAEAAARFYRSLGARYDALFSELANVDAGWAQIRGGEGAAAWWNATDFARDVRFLDGLHRRVRLPIVLWQIPLGNTLMRAMNDTPFHYQDNKVQYFLGSGSRSHLKSYVRSGVVALLFGSSQDEDTCACDASGDGITNPAPIDGNIRLSLSADDDGGYFRAQVGAYYREGALRLF
jgi:hypothetical protein